MNEAQLAESRKDATHNFVGDGNAFDCGACGKPRALHYHDGFKPSTLPSKLGTDPKHRYRGPHPYWTPPGRNFAPAKEFQSDRHPSSKKVPAEIRGTRTGGSISRGTGQAVKSPGFVPLARTILRGPESP